MERQRKVVHWRSGEEFDGLVLNQTKVHIRVSPSNEWINRIITDNLAKSVNKDNDDWSDWLPAKVFACNTTVQKSKDMHYLS